MLLSNIGNQSGTAVHHVNVINCDRYLAIAWGVNSVGSQSSPVPLTKVVTVNTGTARLVSLWFWSFSDSVADPRGGVIGFTWPPMPPSQNSICQLSIRPIVGGFIQIKPPTIGLMLSWQILFCFLPDYIIVVQFADYEQLLGTSFSALMLLIGR